MAKETNNDIHRIMLSLEGKDLSPAPLSGKGLSFFKIEFTYY
ncbi:hypothetical protein [Neobacillus soli]|nr:hypothetical protein [Neobacillus soli]